MLFSEHQTVNGTQPVGECRQKVIRPNQSTKLTIALHVLHTSNQHVTTCPVKVESFLHTTSGKNLKLERIPADCDDWDWLKTMTKLEDLNVYVVDGEKKGRLRVSLFR